MLFLNPHHLLILARKECFQRNVQGDILCKITKNDISSILCYIGRLLNITSPAYMFISLLPEWNEELKKKKLFCDAEHVSNGVSLF